MNKISGWTPIFSDLVLKSSIWSQSKEVKVLWITMLALVGKDSVVEGTVPGLARQSGLTVEEVESALEVLMAPNPYSTTDAKEGRRVEKIEGGWFIVNHSKYRNKVAEERRDLQLREAQQRYRNKKSTPKPPQNPSIPY